MIKKIDLNCDMGKALASINLGMMKSLPGILQLPMSPVDFMREIPPQ